MSSLHEIESQIFNELGIQLSIIPDGQPHRFYDPHGKPRNRDGAYRASNAGDGGFLCSVWSYNANSPLSSSANKARVFANGRGDSDSVLSTDELREFYKKRALERALEQKEKHQQRENFGSAARRYLARCPRLDQNVNYNIRYLIKKRIPAINLYWGPDKRGENTLIVPAQDINGNVYGYQRIYADGRKLFPAGFPVSGLFCLLGELNPKTLRVELAEGYATGVSVYLANNRTSPVVVAFSANNLPKVATAIHNAYPKVTIVGRADNDRSGAGRTYMIEAMAKCNNGSFTLPDFSKCSGDDSLTDYNDLHVVAGLDELRRQLRQLTLNELADSLRAFAKSRF